jgi:hypothetical protein
MRKFACHCTIRRECLDRTLFWTAADLERKLFGFQRYYNDYRAHAGREGRQQWRRSRESRFVSLAAALPCRWQREVSVRCVRTGTSAIRDVSIDWTRSRRHVVGGTCVEFALRVHLFVGRVPHDQEFATHRELGCVIKKVRDQKCCE